MFLEFEIQTYNRSVTQLKDNAFKHLNTFIHLYHDPSLSANTTKLHHPALVQSPSSVAVFGHRLRSPSSIKTRQRWTVCEQVEKADQRPTLRATLTRAHSPSVSLERIHSSISPTNKQHKPFDKAESHTIPEDCHSVSNTTSPNTQLINQLITTPTPQPPTTNYGYSRPPPATKILHKKNKHHLLPR